MDGNESDGSDNGYEEHRDNENELGDRGGPWDSVRDMRGGGAAREGGADRNDDDGEMANSDDDSDVELPFDISIAASHSYLGPGLENVGGRRVLEAGWRGTVPTLAHHGVLFPGETVPMLLPHSPDAVMLVEAIKHDKLFGLLCPDETATWVSGYGVLCEVLMAGIQEGQDAAVSVTFKARAIHRFRMVRMPKEAVHMEMYARMRFVEVMVLAEMPARDTLRAARLASLDHLRTPTHLEPLHERRRTARLRSMDAAVTPWPLFVYDIFDYDRLRVKLQEYFRTIMLEDKLPEEPVSLSFWVASNLALSARDRLALFVVDSALLRLHMECHFITKKSMLCCSSCMTPIAQREHIFAMSSDGVHSNYTNLGGYMHDILTVSQASNVDTSGSPSAEYSWFPGYAWTVALCVYCVAHVGWRFVATKRNLRPHEFYGLCRNHVQPRHDGDTAPPAPPAPHAPPAPL